MGHKMEWMVEKSKICNNKKKGLYNIVAKVEHFQGHTKMKLVTEVPHLAKMCGIKTLVDKIRPEDYRSVYRLFKRADNAAVKKGGSAKLIVILIVCSINCTTKVFALDDTASW